MKKKVVSLLLVFTLMFSLSVQAFAAYLPFTDVPENAWYRMYVEFVYSKNIMSGTSSTKFSPGNNLKREDAVVLLGKVYEQEHRTTISSNYSNPFSDVQNSSAYYYKYIGWAKTNGIVNGVSATKFGVGNYVSRKDFCVMIYNYQQKIRRASFKDHSNGYAPPLFDIANLTATEKTAVNALHKGSVVTGDSNGKFRPYDNITRAEVASVMTHLHDKQNWLR